MTIPSLASLQDCRFFTYQGLKRGCQGEWTMNKEVLLEECKIGWLSVEKDFKARLLKPELLKHGKNQIVVT